MALGAVSFQICWTSAIAVRLLSTSAAVRNRSSAASISGFA
jgi:hypothetical protein